MHQGAGLALYHSSWIVVGDVAVVTTSLSPSVGVGTLADTLPYMLE